MNEGRSSIYFMCFTLYSFNYILSHHSVKVIGIFFFFFLMYLLKNRVCFEGDMHMDKASYKSTNFL